MKTGLLDSESEMDDTMLDQSLFRMNYFFKETQNSRSMLSAEEYLHSSRL